jgi:NitT/TauT family transport system substrate-binding protein
MRSTPTPRRTALAALLAGLLPLAAAGPAPAAETLVVAEPVHSIGYLPLYVAMHQGYFKEEGLALKVLTTQGGGAHTNAVLTGQAFAFIGGPEHNAFAKAKGAELRAVVNVVNRGNVYFVARPDMPAPTDDLAAYFKGKTIAVSFYGGTPNSITRYLLAKLGLDPRKDVKLLETSSAAVLAAMATKRADIGVTSEPILHQGLQKGIWSEPFYNVPKELGPYTYSTINIQKASIDKKPEVVRGFVRAVIRGLRYTYANPDAAAAIAKKEFPTMPLDQLKATLDRSFADELWSPDGMILPAAWDTGSKVVRQAGILKTDVAYDDIIDMRFVKEVLGGS